MGYRHYIGIVNDEDIELIKNKSIKDKDYDEDYYDFIDDKVKNIHELGDLSFINSEDIYDALYETHENLTNNPNIELFICDQEILLKMANIYRKKARNYYKELYKKLDKDLNDKTALGELFMNCREKVFALSDEFSKDKDLSVDWSYEYQMFQLMYLYKTLNLKGKKLVVYAH